MSIVMILILGGAVVMGLALVALLAIVGIVTRRPSIVAVAGLVCLLGIGGVLGSFVGVRTSARSHVHYNGMEITPRAVNMMPPDYISHDVTMQMPEGMNVRATWSIAIVPMFLLGALVITGILALVVRASRSASGGRRSVWPAIVAVPAIGLLLMVFAGYLKLRAVQKFSGAPAFEQMPQDFSMMDTPAANPEFMAIRRQSIDQLRAQAQHIAEAQHQRVIEVAEAKRSHELAVTAAQRQHESEIQEQLRRQALKQVAILNAQLQHQLATMDINQLIDIFTAPKINLGPVLVEAATNSTPPAPAAEAPVIAPEIIHGPAVVAPLAIAPPVAAIVPADPTAPVVAVAVAEASTKSKTAEAVVSSTESTTLEKASDAAHPNDVNKPPAVEDSSAKVTIKKSKNGAAAAAVAVAPLDKKEAMPSWVNEKPGMYGQDYREIVSTDEYATEDEARRAMDVLLMLKTAEHVRSLMGQQFIDHRRPSVSFYQGLVHLDGNVAYDARNPNYWYDEDLRLLHSMGIGMNEIRRSVVRDQYMATRESSRALNTMYKQYTQAQFTPWFDDQLKKHWLVYKRQDRFERVGIGATSVIGLLAFVFGLLKVDTWTKGYYTKRLFIGVPAMIIGGSMLVAVIGSMM